MVRYANHLIFISMNINQNLKNKWKIIKNVINKLILASNHHQTTIVACFISPVMQFDKVCYIMVLYENYLICIFVNINEYLKRRAKSLVKLVPHGVIRPILNESGSFCPWVVLPGRFALVLGVGRFALIM